MPPSRTEKKKKPPSFQHFPAERAKVLKKAWVERAKIKSKWKTEKRKMGLADIPKPSLNAIDDVGDEAAQEGPQTSDSEANAQVVDSPSARVETSKAKRGSQPKKSAEPISADADRKDTKSDELRDLARKAYSRDSLHTYKSDPLSRRNKGTPANKKGGGKGQPNMKLRMNYMLEKIKRDYS